MPYEQLHIFSESTYFLPASAILMLLLGLQKSKLSVADIVAKSYFNPNNLISQIESRKRRDTPIFKMPKTSKEHEMSGVCLPYENGEKIDKNYTYCGNGVQIRYILNNNTSDEVKIAQFEQIQAIYTRNQRGDGLKILLERANRSTEWKLRFYYNIKSGGKIVVKLGNSKKEEIHTIILYPELGTDCNNQDQIYEYTREMLEAEIENQNIEIPENLELFYIGWEGYPEDFNIDLQAP